MPRTTIPAASVVVPKGPNQGVVSAEDLDVPMQAADVGNKNQVKMSQGDVLLMQNSGASPYTITLTSAPDERKRTGDVTAYSLAAGDVCAFAFGDLGGWVQADGFVYFEASNASVKFAVLRRS